MRNLIVCLLAVFCMVCVTQPAFAQFNPPDLCGIIPSLPQCGGDDDGEVANCSVEQTDAEGCFEVSCPDGSSAVLCDGADGEDGVSCDVLVSDRVGCVNIVCGDSITVVCNGVDGDDGADGGSCHAEVVDEGVLIFCDNEDGVSLIRHGDSCTVVEEDSCTTVIRCEDGSVSRVANGVSCFDLNGNCLPDLCDPLALEIFDTCEDFFDYCNDPQEDYENGLPLDCSFTEDVNSDGVVNSLDCIGPVGPTGGAGGTGAPGEDGFNCFDLNMNHLADPEEDVNGDGVVDVMDCVGPVGNPGADADPCTVVDNLDGTVTVVCPDGSEVTLGDLIEFDPQFIIEPELEELSSPLCGTFGGSLIVLGFPMLGFYCVRRRW